MISDDKVGAKGVKVRCKKCGNIITVKHGGGADASGDAGASAPVTSPAPAGNFDDMFSAGPPAAGGEDGSYERAPTKVFTTADLQRVREEQVRAGAPAPAATVAATVATAAPEPAIENERTTVTQVGSFAAAAAAALETTAEEKPEWYVAINDDQIGPITRSDLQGRWDKGEVKRETLAWKQGLADWQAVQAVQELNWLSQRPQAVSGGVKAAEPVKPEPAKEAEKPAVTWRPSGASALAALAKEAVEEPKKEAPAPNPLGDFTPQTPTGDGFGGMPSFNQGPQTMWQMPQTAPKRSGGGLKWVIAAMGVVLVLVAGVALYALGYIGPRPPPVVAQQPIATPPPVAPQPGQPGYVAPVALQPGQPGYVPPVAALQPGQPGYVAPVAALQPGQPGYLAPVAANPPAGGYPPAPPQPAGGRKGRQPKTGGTTGGGEASAKPEPTEPKKSAKAGGMDDLFNNKPAAAAGKATLDRNDVLSVVRGAIPNLKSCVEKYNSGGGKTLPGKLILKFVIVPSGNTSAQEMASPELKGTSVDGCVVSIIRGMKFPEYQSGNIPVTFPIPLGQ